MGTKSNPQITIPRATFDELQQIADVWGLPSPGLVVPMMVKQFGHLMKDGLTLPTSTPNYSTAVETTAMTANLQASSTESTPNYSDAVETTANYSTTVETTASESPANAFFEMEF